MQVVHTYSFPNMLKHLAADENNQALMPRLDLPCNDVTSQQGQDMLKYAWLWPFKA